VASTVDGVVQLETYYGKYLPQLLVTVLAPVGILVYLWSLDPPLAVATCMTCAPAIIRVKRLPRWNTVSRPCLAGGSTCWNSQNPAAGINGSKPRQRALNATGDVTRGGGGHLAPTANSGFRSPEPRPRADHRELLSERRGPAM